MRRAEAIFLCLTLTACGSEDSNSEGTYGTAEAESGETAASTDSQGEGTGSEGSTSNSETGGDGDSGTATAGDGDSTGTDSTGTDSTGTDSTGTDSTGTDSTGTDSTGTDSTGTDSTGTDTTGSTSTSTGSNDEWGGDGDSGCDETTTGTGGGTTDGMECMAPGSYTDCDGTPGGGLTNHPFHAVGLDCPCLGPDDSIQIDNPVMNANNNASYEIMAGFGTAAGSNYGGLLWAANNDDWTSPNDEVIPPNTSTAVLMLSTGVIASPNADDIVIEAADSQTGNGDNSNEDTGELPPPMSPLQGSENGAGGNPFNNCDGVNDCSDSLYDQWVNQMWNDPNDKIWMSFDVTVPQGTEGYVFDFAYFSSEWPTYVDTTFNDLFIAWQVSEAFTGNVTFVNGAPLTITSLDAAGAFQYITGDPQLAGTGFESNAGTGWFTARGAVVPGEVASITWFLADMGDSILATNVILDNFRWECTGCVPNEIDDCGVDPLPE